MKTPRIPLTALALLLAAAAAASAGDEPKTADGKIIVTPDAFGPFPTPTCVAGSPECTPAGDPATTNSLMDIGKQQQEESGAKMLPPDKVDKLVEGEDAGLKNGDFKDIHRTPYGSVITFPDGRISWSSYKTGQTTLPIDPAKCASNPQCPPELKSYAEDQSRKDKDQKEFQAKNDAMYTGNKTMYGQDNNSGKGTETAVGSKDSSSDSQSDASSGDVDKQGRQQGEDLATLIAGNKNGAQNPETSSEGETSVGQADQPPAVETSGSNGDTPEGYTYLPVLNAKHKAEEILAGSKSFKDAAQTAPSGAGQVKKPFTIEANNSR